MSAIPPRCFRCSAWASRCGRSTPCSSPTTPATANGRAGCSTPSMIREVVGGIAKREVLGECDGVLSGYMGGADIGAAILEAVATVKRANPSAKYCCDPVIGDVGRGVFVREGIPEFMKREGGAGRRRDHAQPVRARLSHRRRKQHAGAGLRGGRCAARTRSARRAGHLAARRGDAGGCDRSRRLRRERAAFRCARRGCSWW